MLESEIQVNKFLLGYGLTLIRDIADERWTEQPMAGVNHPAWILGHLAWAADGALEKLGGQKSLPADWPDLFKAGSKPTATRSHYPSREALLHAVENNYQQLRKLAAAATPEQLAAPTTHPRAKDALPTLKEMASFLLTGHVGVHMGQLSSWRRMIGLTPMF
jgi:hypothetical protein